MPYRQTTVAGLPAVSLFNDIIELIALPGAGGRITHLRRRRRGREWMWHNPVLPFTIPPARPDPSPSIYVDRFDSGGWDECFPTVGPCPLPGGDDRLPDLPDHGELWYARWKHDVFTGPGCTTWRSVTECHSVPATFSRHVDLPEGDDENGRVHLSYSVRSSGDRPFPFLWSAHPVLNVQPGTRIELPGIDQVRVDAVLGRTDLPPDGEIPWPPGGGGTFVMPPKEAWAAKLFARSPQSARARVIDPVRGEVLELTWDGGEIPWLGLWVNPGGFGPAPSGHYTLAVEPCLAAPDRLDRAVADWRVAPVLLPGEERTWRLTVVLRDEPS